MDPDNSKEAFELLIASHSDDATKLTAIEAQLSALQAPWAGPMRLRVINLKRSLNIAGRSGAESTSATTKKPAWGIPFGLPLPDGRPLFGYRLSSGAFATIETHLRDLAGTTGFVRPQDSALFVIWAADWFRRSFKGGLRRWSDIEERLGIEQTQSDWRALTDRGLRIWQLSPLRLHGATHRLLNLARQGGFPVAALEEDAGGWAACFLERLVGVLLSASDPSIDTAFSHARTLVGLVPAGWQCDDFLAVSADLALAVVLLRREAEAGGAIAGLPHSIWLDANLPDWRDRLPLVIDSEAGRRLVDGLMKAVAIKGGGEAIRIGRLLERIDGHWEQRSRFELNGCLKSADLVGLDVGWSRLRMFACAELARYVPGELAIVEPSDDGVWASIATQALESASVPFDVAAEVELRGGGERLGPTLLLGQGAPVSGPLLVCRRTDETVEAAADKLELIGTASGKYRADPLHVVVPSGWTLEAHDEGETVEAIESLFDDRRLWRVEGGALVKSPEGDGYRLLAGQALEERDALALSGQSPSHCVSKLAIPLLLGPPTLFVRERARERTPRSEEAWWRPQGTRDWRPFVGFDGLGACEFAWRDRSTGLIRDRKTAIILPRAFQLTVRGAGDQAELAVFGWPGEVVVRPGFRTDDNRWRLRTRGANEARAAIMLTGAGAAPFQIDAQLPHQAWIVDWSGIPLPARKRIALADIHMLVARADGRCELMAQLIDRKGVRIPQGEIRWTFEQELPLNGIRDDLAALLRPFADIDAEVELNFNDAQEDYWYVREFDAALAGEPRGLVPTRAIVEEAAHLFGRALHQPARECDLGAYGLVEQINHRPIEVMDLRGGWLLYLRAGGRVLTRPYLHYGHPIARPPFTPLGRMMAIHVADERRVALEELCAEVEAGGPRGNAILREIVELVVGLNGLPPATFDVLGAIAIRPLLAARLMFEAGDQEISAVGALAGGLPLAWPLIPRRLWERAAELRFEAIMEALPEALADRLTLAAGAIAAARARIAAAEPAASELLGLSNPGHSVREAAQAFMQRAYDRAETFSSSPFRPRFAGRLPAWPFSERCWRALDAPCAAALAAIETIQLDDEQLRCVKDVARRHPRYFEQAFPAMLMEASIG